MPAGIARINDKCTGYFGTHMHVPCKNGSHFLLKEVVYFRAKREDVGRGGGRERNFPLRWP